MCNLYDIIFKSLEQSSAQKLNMMDSARLAVRRVEQAGGTSVLNIEMINGLKTLNCLLIKIIREVCPHKSREVFDKLLKVGLVYTPEGVKELSLNWNEFYKEQVHLQVLHGIAHCMLLAVQDELCKTPKGLEMIRLLKSQPQIVNNREFLKNLSHILSQAHQQEQKNSHATMQYAQAISKNNSIAPRCSIEPFQRGPSCSIVKGPSCSTEQDKAITKNTPNTFELRQDEPSTLQQYTNQYNQARLDTIKIGQDIKNDLYKDIGDFLLLDSENKQRLCVLKIKNVNEMISAFGADGYSRAISSIKTLVIENLKQICKDTKVFSPRVGVLYALSSNAYEVKMDEFIKNFCTQKRTFAFRGERVSLEFDGRIFNKSNGFLCTILDMQSFVG